MGKVDKIRLGVMTDPHPTRPGSGPSPQGKALASPWLAQKTTVAKTPTYRSSVGFPIRLGVMTDAVESSRLASSDPARRLAHLPPGEGNWPCMAYVEKWPEGRPATGREALMGQGGPGAGGQAVLCGQVITLPRGPLRLDGRSRYPPEEAGGFSAPC